jgi:hypothetical protein
MQRCKNYFLILLFINTSLYTYAQAPPAPTSTQPNDPGGLYVYTTQNLAFGAFYHGNTGGTIVIGNDGTRTVTGDVVGLNMGMTYYNATFDIEAPPGTIISISNGPDVTLTGSSGGSVILKIGSSYPAAPFTTTLSPPARTQVSIGGTLTIGNNASTPAGNYSGTFYITFNHQ